MKTYYILKHDYTTKERLGFNKRKNNLNDTQYLYYFDIISSDNDISTKWVTSEKEIVRKLEPWELIKYKLLGYKFD